MAVPLRVIASGTVLQSAMKISAVDGGATASGGAFIDLLATTFESSKSVLGPTAIAAGSALLDTTTANAFIGGGPDLTAYQTGNYKIRLRNTASQAIAEAWISATAPSGEALDSNLYSPFDFTSGWATSGCTITNATDFVTSSAGGPYRTSGGSANVAGALYKSSIVGTTSAGTVTLRDQTPNVTFTTGFSAEMYATAINAARDWVRVTTAANVSISAINSQKVTMPAATGALLLSTKSGSRGYLRKDAAFDPNAAMTIEVFSANPLPQYIGHLVRIKDSAGRAIQGYIKAAGSGETSAELLANGDFSGTWTGNLPQSWGQVGSVTGASYLVADDANNRLQVVSDGSSMGVSQGAGTINSLVNYTLNLNTVTSGSARMIFGSGSPSIISKGTSGILTGYTVHNGTDEYIYLVRLSGSTNFIITSASAKRVLTPSATGCTIVSSKGGATYNFAQKNSAFNYNDVAGYTYEILKNSILSGNRDGVGVD
jgi:hypothetical protein